MMYLAFVLLLSFCCVALLYALPAIQRRIKLASFSILALTLASPSSFSQSTLDNYNITWTTQSKNSSESMPCGGGDIGLNVWVENGDLLFYMARSGSFDEHNALLKSGRTRIRLSPSPFEGKDFRQQLDLKTGSVMITAANGGVRTSVKIWVDVFQPVIHTSIEANKGVHAEIFYENWRYKDRLNTGRENRANSYKWEPQGDIYTFKDSIGFENNSVLFFHRNKPETVFDFTVKHEGMESVKDQLYNPLKNLTFGGKLSCTNTIANGTVEGKYINTDYKAWKLKSKSSHKKYEVSIHLHTEQTGTIQQWKQGLDELVAYIRGSVYWPSMNQKWWNNFWNRSFIYINPNKNSENDTGWQAGRNYQLFRYMLALNANGTWPTKFNGGLLTYDPVFTDTAHKLTPDFRNWGGGTHTAQNQRLVYFPMIKSGDFEMMKPQFDFYLRILKNAELRSKVYWNHAGACFTEQMENFGLPNPVEYGIKRPAGYDKGMEWNAWLEYEWDTVLEFCLMMLEQERYQQKDISVYIPFIESCLRFFDEHYQYLAKERGRKALDGNNHLVLFPGSGAETYKMAYNATSTIAALKTVTSRLLELPSNYLDTIKRAHFLGLLNRIPPLSFATFNGQKTIAPAKLWERVNNTETSQLYPVFPWGMYGIGQPDLEVAKNTYLLDTFAIKFRSHVGWKQDNIFAARLGLTDEAKRLTTLKLQNSGRRFPAFWGPGFDWTPDHNWGGSGMIGLQEMLLQVDDKKIYLFPAWPKEWDVHFKLHAPYQTTVEGIVKDGKIQSIKVLPAEREKDIINLFEK